MKNKTLIQTLIIAIGFPLTQLALILYTPAYAAISHSFNVDIKDMLFSFTINLTGYTLGTLFWGILSDKIGRRFTMIIGLSFYIATSIIISFTQNYISFLILLSLFGFAAATFTSVGNAMLRDIYGKEKIKRVIAFVGIAMATTPAVAPFLGSHIIKWFNWQTIYYFLALVGILMLIGIVKFIPNLATPQTQQGSLSEGVKNHLKNRNFIGYITGLGLLMGCIMCTLEMLPVIYTHYLNLNLLTFGYISLLFMLPYPLGAAISSKFVAHLETRNMIIIGSAIGICSAILLTLLAVNNIKNELMLSINIALLFLAYGLSFSMSKAGAMSSIKHNAGSASSLMKFVQSAGGMLFTAINAALHQDKNITNFAIILAALLISCQLIALIVIKRHPTKAVA